MSDPEGAAVRPGDPRWEQIEKALDELNAWVNTDISGCVEVMQRGEAALKAFRELRREVSNQDTERDK